MTGRPSKTTVDYFPHYTTSKKTIFTLQSLYGNDGYAFWFKLLEILGNTDGHCFRYEKPADWLFLVAKTGVSEEKAKNILQTLADLEAIDAELYAEKVLWSDNFVTGLIPVYDKRSTEIPVKPSLRGEKEVSVEKTPQSIVKESKGEKPIIDYSEKFILFWEQYPNKQGKAKAFEKWKAYRCENGKFDTIMDALERFKNSKDWKKDDGQYIPHGGTWINQKRWEDEVTEISTRDCSLCDYMARGKCDKNDPKCTAFIPRSV